MKLTEGLLDGMSDPLVRPVVALLLVGVDRYLVLL